MANDMDRVDTPPRRFVELPQATQRFLAGMRPEEMERLRFLIEEFTVADLEVFRDNLENMRTLKRFGKAALWFFGFIIAGAGAAGIIKTFFWSGGSK